MPKLLAFLPCEKVIISEKDNVATLIAILQEITAQLPSGITSVPEGTIGPLTWFVFAMWVREPNDDPTAEHKMSVTMIFPSGKTKELIKDYVFSFSQQTMRNIVQSVGFPLHETGGLTLVLNFDGQDVATYPLLVKHEHPASSESSPA